MKLPEIKNTKEARDIYHELVKIKYFDYVLDKEEKENYLKYYGPKISKGLKKKYSDWLDSYSEFIDKGGWVCEGQQ